MRLPEIFGMKSKEFLRNARLKGNRGQTTFYRSSKNVVCPLLLAIGWSDAGQRHFKHEDDSLGGTIGDRPRLSI